MVQTDTGMIAPNPGVVDSWKNPTNVQAVFRGGNGPWTQTQCPIASIAGPAITMAEPCWHNLDLKAAGVQEISWFTSPMGGFGGLGMWKTPTYFENLYSAMSTRHVDDRPGRAQALLPAAQGRGPQQRRGRRTGPADPVRGRRHAEASGARRDGAGADVQLRDVDGDRQQQRVPADAGRLVPVGGEREQPPGHVRLHQPARDLPVRVVDADAGQRRADVDRPREDDRQHLQPSRRRGARPL